MDPARIEHTALGPTTTWADVRTVLDAAIRYGMRARIPPQHVADAADYAPGVELTTVVAFPHGQHATSTTVAAARTAWEDGAAGVDLVPDHGRLLGDETEAYRAGIAEVVAAVPIPVTAIVETALLDDAALEAACEAAVAAEAAVLGTSTGFVAGGATLEAVGSLAEYGPVKAIGDLDSPETAETLVEAGAERIGTAAGATIAEGE